MGTENLTGNGKSVVFFDGVCGLCDRTVQFILRHDSKKRLRFAALQSEAAKHILGEKVSMDSFIYFQDGIAYTRSTGALKTLRALGGPWSLLYAFMIVPPFIRDRIYNWVARHRYQWFGHFDACKIPTPDQRERFLE